MKFCPVCKTRYDEEILRFCTKDGAPLVDEALPSFTDLPSASAGDDLGEETVIRRKPKANAAVPAALPEDFDEEHSYQTPRNSAERIVIPTAEQQREQQQVRTKNVAYQPPPSSNTGKVVLLTILGTLVVLAGAGGVFWFLRSQTPAANTNLNVNTNPYNISTNVSTNLNLDNSFNFNTATNANLNTNLNANSNANANINKTPTPTPKLSPSPTPKPSETPEGGNTNSAVNANSSIPATPPRPPVSPTPAVSPTPRVSPSAPPANRPVNAGILNGQAINLPKPAYPATARAVHANGQVTVQITLDENGSVMSAKALSGNPLLRQPAEAAARQSRFNPIRVAGQPVSATGVLIYNFVN